MTLWLLRAYSLHSSFEKSLRCAAGDREANQMAVEALMGRLQRRFLVRRRRKVRFNSKFGSRRGGRELEVEEECELDRRWFGERIDRREGGEGERLLVPSCANLRRSKLLKYWCNRHVSWMGPAE